MESSQHAGHHRQGLILLVIALLLGACGRTVEPASPSSISGGSEGTPIVFVPGIKGSALADERGDIVFLTRLEAMGLSNPGLASPTRFEGSVQDRDGRQAAGILREMFIVPGLIGEDIYGPWIDALAHQQRPAYLFPYDWRRDNLETLDELATFVAQVRELHGKPVQLIGHSMGGMLSLALLAHGSTDIAKLALVGSPLRGGIGFMPDLHDGVSVGLSGSLLGPDVIATFPSVYSFFPSTPGTDVDIPMLDFFDPKAWPIAKLGPYKDGRSPSAEFGAFFATAIERAKEFRRLVELEPETSIPITIVAGDAHPTLTSMRHDGATWDFASTARTPGDGRVPLDRTQPRRSKYDLLTTPAEHAGLLNDPKIAEALLAP